MNDLVTFLRARLDEDERNAPMAGGFAWRSGYSRERLLRDVEAKRAILQGYLHADGSSSRDRDRGRWDALHAAVRAIGAVYRDHPDYQQEWAP